jgi:hypothetical protein
LDIPTPGEWMIDLMGMESATVTGTRGKAQRTETA